MYHYGHLLGQTTLQHAQVRRGFVLGDQRLDRLAVEQREYLDISLGILVAYVEPELVELVR